jgi:hypothetical protein
MPGFQSVEVIQAYNGQPLTTGASAPTEEMTMTVSRAINPHRADYHIAQLRTMTTVQADRYLCGLPSDYLLDIGASLGVDLPVIGGDKPTLILTALERTA